MLSCTPRAPPVLGPCWAPKAAPSSASSPEDVWLIALIAPQRSTGSRVSPVDYVRLEFEGKAVHFHEKDRQLGLSRNPAKAIAEPSARVCRRARWSPCWRWR